MKQTYNLDEDINRIKTGDTVLVCGLYGKNFKFINNKWGKVVGIMIRNEGNELLHIADIEIKDTGKVYAVNFDFIYKITFDKEHIIDNPVQHLMTIDNPIVYYIALKKFKHTMNFHDDMGQFMALCIDANSKTHAILFSGIN